MNERPHVLVVDHDARIGAALKRSLHYEGYSVEVAETGPLEVRRAGRRTWSSWT